MKASSSQIQVSRSRMLFCFLLHQNLSFTLLSSLPYMPLVIPPSSSPRPPSERGPSNSGPVSLLLSLWYSIVCTCTFHLYSVQCSAVQAVNPTGCRHDHHHHFELSFRSSSLFIQSFIPSELVPSAKVADTAELALRGYAINVLSSCLVFGRTSYIVT